jgi:hypothetical protein
MNEVNVKKLEGSFVFYKYPCKQVTFNQVE